MAEQLECNLSDIEKLEYFLREKAERVKKGSNPKLIERISRE